MKKKLQIPRGFKPYKTIEGKFAACFKLLKYSQNMKKARKLTKLFG